MKIINRSHFKSIFGIFGPTRAFFSGPGVQICADQKKIFVKNILVTRPNIFRFYT